MNYLHTSKQRHALSLLRYVSVSILYNILHFKYFRLIFYYCVTRNEGPDKILDKLSATLKNNIISLLVERQMVEQSASGR